VTLREPAVILARIPGWENAGSSVISRGSNNIAWLLTSGSRAAVLKLGLAAREFPLNTRAGEAEVQARAARAGIAPAVLYFDDEVLLEEYVPGPAWTGKTLSLAGRLEQLCRTLKVLHALPPTGRRFPLMEAARHYYARLPGGADRARAERCLVTLSGVAAPETPCCCHNDLVAGNIISASGPVLIDWEYAADNDPMFDLASLVAHHRIGPAGRERLLSACFGSAAADYRERLLDSCKAYRALAWLWRASRP
jgi:aminoglycoside phosphotransferase (APT) family kinase protein